MLLLARAKGALEGESISAPLEVLGLCCLSDVIRENAADTLAYFRRQGVTVKVISGDDPRTVAHIARRVGLEGWGKRRGPPQPWGRARPWPRLRSATPSLAG